MAKFKEPSKSTVVMPIAGDAIEVKLPYWKTWTRYTVYACSSDLISVHCWLGGQKVSCFLRRDGEGIEWRISQKQGSINAQV